MNANTITRATKIYADILTIGLNGIRNAATAGNVELCRIEAEHLHNLPSLMDDSNIARHLYYFNQERVVYIKSLEDQSVTGSGDYRTEMCKIYLPYWDAILECLSSEVK